MLNLISPKSFYGKALEHKCAKLENKLKLRVMQVSRFAKFDLEEHQKRTYLNEIINK